MYLFIQPAFTDYIYFVPSIMWRSGDQNTQKPNEDDDGFLLVIKVKEGSLQLYFVVEIKFVIKENSTTWV